MLFRDGESRPGVRFYDQMPVDFFWPLWFRTYSSWMFYLTWCITWFAAHNSFVPITSVTQLTEKLS